VGVGAKGKLVGYTSRIRYSATKGCIWLRRFSIQIVARGNYDAVFVSEDSEKFLMENLPSFLSLASRKDAPLSRNGTNLASFCIPIGMPITMMRIYISADR
jgi:hypothetical protein